MDDKPVLTSDSQQLIDTFCDTLWLEDGLARNSLDAYRRDMTAFALWLEQSAHKPLLDANLTDMNAYAAARHQASKPSSANRRLAVFKRFYQMAIRQNHITEDPCLKMHSAKQGLRFPKTLSEANVVTLLNAPDVDTPLGLRDRTMLELMYASGLRVTELVLLKTVELGMNEGVLRVTGKGNKTRLVPFGDDIVHVGSKKRLVECILCGRALYSAESRAPGSPSSSIEGFK